MSEVNDYERVVSELVETLAALPESLTNTQVFEAVVNQVDKAGVVKRRKKVVWEVLRLSGLVRKKNRHDWLNLINLLNY